jgi:biotin operon repressor
LRNSIEAGTFEDVFFCAPAKGETDRMLRVARKALDVANGLRRVLRSGQRELSAFERKLATLTGTAVRVYEEILTLARLNGGRVFPSYEYLAKATNLGRTTVMRALAKLEALGFIVRQRRFKRIEGNGPGPRYEQTSNAYRPLLPTRVLAFMPSWLRPAPIPVDAEQWIADQASEKASMLAGLSCRELAEATVGGALGRVLARLGAEVDRREREVHIGSEPRMESYYLGKIGVGLRRPTR